MTAATGARAHIAVFAKAPQAGLAKTRLAPALGAAGAAALAERLLGHAVAQAVAAATGPVTIWTTPDATHPAFARLQREHGLSLAVQQGPDLGARMHFSFLQTLAADPQTPLLLMGCDAPALDAAALRAAAAALLTHDAVFVPAHDGGYALVGLRRPRPQLFDGMTWSTPQVMADTRQRLRAAGLSHAELQAVHDIDVAADLVHLPAAWQGASPGCGSPGQTLADSEGRSVDNRGLVPPATATAIHVRDAP